MDRDDLQRAIEIGQTMHLPGSPQASAAMAGATVAMKDAEIAQLRADLARVAGERDAQYGAPCERGCGFKVLSIDDLDRAHRLREERDTAIAQMLATQSQAAQSVLDATARAEAAERERDEARWERDCEQGARKREVARAEAAEAQRDNVLDAHKEGAWMARALDAERRAAEAERELHHAAYVGDKARKERDAAEARADAAEKRADQLAAELAEVDMILNVVGSDAAFRSSMLRAVRARLESAEKRAVEAEQERDDARMSAATAKAHRDHWRTVAESRPDISREDAAAFLVAVDDARFNEFVEHRSRVVDAIHAHATAPKGDTSEAPEPDAEPKRVWWCQHCEEEVASSDVTYEETHDRRNGGCGHAVDAVTRTGRAGGGR